MDIGVTKMSSKGQIVIPIELREGIKEGDKLIVMKAKGQLIIKKMSEFEKNIEEDIEFARRTERAWKEYDKGKFKSMDADEFLKELEKW